MHLWQDYLRPLWLRFLRASGRPMPELRADLVGPHMEIFHLVLAMRDGSYISLNIPKELADDYVTGFQGRWAREAKAGYNTVSFSMTQPGGEPETVISFNPADVIGVTCRPMNDTDGHGIVQVSPPVEEEWN